jgi:hypothetical protein
MDDLEEFDTGWKVPRDCTFDRLGAGLLPDFRREIAWETLA